MQAGSIGASIVLLLPVLAPAQVFLPSKELALPANTSQALLLGDAERTRRLQEDPDYAGMAEALTPIMEYFKGLGGKLASGEELTAEDKEELQTSIRDSFIASIPLVATAVGGPVGGFVGMLLVSMFTTMVNSGQGSVWDNMKTYFNGKLLRENLLNFESSIDHEIDELHMYMGSLDHSNGADRKDRLVRIEEKLDSTYRNMIFRPECIKLVWGKVTTEEQNQICQDWREIGMHEIGFVFAVLHLEILLELATWSDASVPLSDGQKTYYFEKTRRRVKEYHPLLSKAWQVYTAKRLSWFKPPKWSTGLNCNLWTRKCMVSDGQDCMYSDKPDICIKNGNVWPTDECPPQTLPGARGACDVLSYYCRVPGRINPWENFIMGTKMYYWMMTESEKNVAVSCYQERYNTAVADLDKFATKLLGLKRLEESLAPFVLSSMGSTACPSGSEHVLDLQACKDAGREFDARDCTDFQGGHHGADGLLGCTINTANNCFHFNIDNLGRTLGTRHASSKYLCKKSS